MPLDESIFADYAAAQGDFGPAALPAPPQAMPNIPIPQSPVAGMEFQGPTGGQVAGQAQQAVSNSLEEVGNHPVFQFYDQWKKSSPEMRKQAEKKLSADFPNPRAMGLFDPTADVEAEAAARKEGKEVKKDKGAWGKFMKFIDSNPRFLLDLGAQLLAPRRGGQSQAGQIASGLHGAMQRLDTRKAAATQTALEGRKTEAEISGIKATASESPSKITLNLARAFKAQNDATGANLPAANVQLLNSITDALWKTGEGTSFNTIEEARIAGQQMISGKGTPEQMAYYKYMTENAILGATPEQAESMLSGAPSLTNIRQQAEQETAQAQAQTTAAQNFVKQHNGDRDSIAQAFMRARNIPLTKALEAADNVISQAGATAAPTAPAVKRTLAGDLTALQGVEKTQAGEKKAEKTRKRQIQRWSSAVPPSPLLASARDKRTATRVIKEIETEYENLSDKEKDRVIKIYNKLKNL